MTEPTALPASRISLSPEEVAQAVGLSRKAVYRAIQRGELVASRLAGASRLRIECEEVLAWHKRGRIATPVIPSQGAGRRSKLSGPMASALSSQVA